MDDNYPQDASMKESMNELSSYDNHPADMGTEMFMASMQMSLKENEKAMLYKIDRVLDRIENNQYGICHICNKNIDIERLEILPETDLCIECEEKEINLYKNDGNNIRNKDVLNSSFGKSNKDDDNYTGFDGEDTYQAVARFNKIKNDPSFGTGDNLGIYDEEE